MGRRRLTSKAPTTPVRSRPKKDSKEVLTTPVQELAMRGLCKEDFFLCSQPNSQIDVKWDCYSPDALQQIKQNRGRVAGDDISDLVMKLADEAGEILTNEPLPGLWTAGNDAAAKQPIHRGLRRSARKRRSKRPVGTMKDLNADDLIHKLVEALNRHDSSEDENGGCQDLKRACPEADLAVPLSVIEEEFVEPSQSSDNLLASPTFGPPRKQVINTSTVLFESAELNTKTVGPPRKQVINTSTVLFESAELNTKTVGPPRKQVINTSTVLFESAEEKTKTVGPPRKQVINTSTVLFESAEEKTKTVGPPRKQVIDTSTVLFESAEEKTKTVGHLRKEVIDTSTDMFESMKNERAAGISTSESLPIPEDPWSDDDLFANTSLLMNEVDFSPPRSTRLSKRKSLMNSPSEPKIKTKRFTEGKVSSSTPVNPGKSLHLSSGNVTKNILMKNNSRETTPLLTAKATSLPTSTSKPTVSINGSSSGLKPNPVRNQVAKQQHKTIQETVQKPQATCRSNQNSLSITKQTSNLGISVSSVCGKVDLIPSTQRTSFKSTTQFSSSRTFKRHNTFPAVTASPKTTDSSSNQPNGITGQNRTNNWQSGYSNYSSTLSKGKDCKNTNQSLHLLPNWQVPKTSSPPGPPTNRARRRSSVGSSSFNTSLTDDLLCQLAEPDDLWDSQVDTEFDQISSINTATTTCSFASTKGIKDNLKKSNSELLSCDAIRPSGPTTRSSISSPSVINHRLIKSNSVSVTSISNCTNGNIKNSKPAGSGESIACVTRNNNNSKLLITDSLKAAPAQSIAPSQGERTSRPGKYQFKSRPSNPQRQASDSKVLVDVPNKLTVKAGGKASVSCASEKLTTVSNLKEMNSEFDDSFLTDDDLSNPQVLAMIEEVEFQASQEPKSPVLKCTQDEIEKKKKAALELRQKKLKLHKKKPVVRQTARHYKPLF